MDYTEEDFLDRIDEEKSKNGKLIERLESAHYLLLFLFDLLQFSFMYLVMADKSPMTKGGDSKEGI